MNKRQLIFNLRMEIAAIRQALRDVEELTEEQVNKLLDRMNQLTEIIKQLED